MKYTRFADIPKLTESGSLECNFDLHRIIPFIREMQEESGLNLEPDFQRAHVWTERQQVAWLEFLLAGGKTGRVIYLNYPSWSRGSNVIDGYDDFVIVDGKQRLEAIRRFTENEIKVYGSMFQEYTDSPRMARVSLLVNVNDLNTREKVLRWYLEMNSGGTPHTDAEIRKVRKMLDAENRKKGQAK